MATTDNLYFSRAAFNDSPGNKLLSAADVTADGGTGLAASHRFLYDTDSGNLFYDEDGVAGNAVQIATLTGAPILSSADILMIY